MTQAPLRNAPEAIDRVTSVSFAATWLEPKTWTAQLLKKSCGSVIQLAVPGEMVAVPLWDAGYVETSTITDALSKAAIRLIPRLRDKIAANYPGTSLLFSEWNDGGGTHISGAVAAADVLGVFGREGISAASYWPLGSNETFAVAAFRAYRNFDGAGAAFGDTSIYASTSDAATASAYGSFDAANPGRLVVILINKATTAKTAGIKIAHWSTFATLKVRTLTSAGAQLMPASDVTATATNAFKYAMPPTSVSVLVPAP